MFNFLKFFKKTEIEPIYMPNSIVEKESIEISKGHITMNQGGLILHCGCHYVIDNTGKIEFKDFKVEKGDTISVVKISENKEGEYKRAIIHDQEVLIKYHNRECEIFRITEDDQEIIISNYDRFDSMYNIILF